MPRTFEMKEIEFDQNEFLTMFNNIDEDTFNDGIGGFWEQNSPFALGAQKQDNVCPAGRTCVPAGDSKGYFVRDTTDGKIYFSEAGWNRYVSGADTDWAGVFRDLLAITGGAIGGVGGGAAAVAGMISLAAWAIDYFRGTAN